MGHGHGVEWFWSQNEWKLHKLKASLKPGCQVRTQVGAAEDVKSAKVRSGCNLDTAEVGDNPAGALVKVIAEKKAKKGAQRLQIEGYLVTGETALTPLAGSCTKKLFVETSAPDLPPPPSDPTPTHCGGGRRDGGNRRGGDDRRARPGRAPG